VLQQHFFLIEERKEGNISNAVSRTTLLLTLFFLS